MTPESLSKLDRYLREDALLRIEPPEGYTLQVVDVDQTDDYSLPYFSLGWGAEQSGKKLGASWWVTVSFTIGLNGLLSIL